MDAADGSTLFQNSDGTTPATATSDPVGYWGDKSGNNRHATQATAGNRPTISATTQNGRRTLGFNGTSHVLASFTSALQPSSIFAVANCTSSGNFPLGNAILASDTTNHPLAWIENGRWELVRWGQNMSGPIAADGTTNILSATNDGTTSTLFVNGGGAVTNAGGTFSSGALTIGAATDTQYFGGRIAELLVYGRALTTTERQKVEGYLAWRWGLQAQLPSNHPYAYSFPGFGSQARPDNGDALAWESEVYSNSGSVSVGTLAAVNTFCNAIDAASIRDRFYRLNLFAGTGLNAALVPLYRGPTYLADPLGSELWSPSTPSITDAGGSSGAWDGSTLTASNSVVGTNGGYPRFQFSLPLTIGKRYAVSGKLTGDTSAVGLIRLSSLPGASNVSYNSGTGVFSARNVPAASALMEFVTNGTLAYSVSIASVSVREELYYGNATDTNNGPFVSGDYAETGATGGLKGNGSSKYLDTGFASNVLGQTDRHMSAFFDLATSLNNRYWFGTDQSGCGSSFWAIGSSSTTSAEFRCGIPGAGSVASSGKIQLLVSGNGTAQSYLNGSASTSISGTAFTAPAQDIFVHALNRCGSPADFGSCRVQAYSLGAAFTAQQAADFYTAILAFQAAMGRV